MIRIRLLPAKRDVWKNWPDCSKRLDELAASTAELSKVAEAGGMAAAMRDMRRCGSVG